MLKCAVVERKVSLQSHDISNEASGALHLHVRSSFTSWRSSRNINALYE